MGMSKVARNLMRTLVASFVLAIMFVACSGPVNIELPLTIQPSPSLSPTVSIPTSTPEPPPPPTLVVCLRQEPDSLYLYAPSNREAESVLAAIYDGPFDIRGFQAQPVILEKMPSFSDGDARNERVSVSEGDPFLNPLTRQLDWLESEMRYMPPDCQTSDCSRVYWSGDVWMEQMVVEFRLRSDVRWSDGVALTAADSVFSFQLDAHKDTPSTKYLVDRTSSYETIDAQTVRWTGIPGYFDPEYQTLFWSPLPQHVLAEYTPADLFELDIAARTPIGWGAYVIESWIPGDNILLRSNAEYFRASEGLPAYEFLIYRFLGDAPPESSLQQILSFECDVVDESLMLPELVSDLLELEQTGRLRMDWAPGLLLERLELNLAPATRSQEPIFAYMRVRRALAACIDRQRIVDEVLLGMGQTSETYIPANHPLYAAPEELLRHDPAWAITELESMGWMDSDDSAETPRVARGVLDVEFGTPLTMAYSYVPGTFQEAAALRVQEDLAQCGAQVELHPLEPLELFIPWPDGEVFGRTFGLLSWAWPTLISPACEMYYSGEIPSDDRPYGINAAAFRNDEYDQACRRILLGAPYGQDYLDAVQSTQRLFSAYLPAIPLYARPRIMAYRPEVCGVEVDPSTFSTLWNLEEYASGEACTQ